MLYDINRNKIDGRKKHFYLKYFKKLLDDLENTTQNIKISVFTNYPERLLSDFTNKPNLKFYNEPFFDLFNKIPVNHNDWGYHSGNYIHVKSISYLNLINSKIGFVAKAIELNNGNRGDRFLFLDAGISRFGNNFKNLTEFDVTNKILVQFINNETNRIRLKFLRDYIEIIDKSRINTEKSFRDIFYKFDLNFISGGIFYGDCSVINTLASDYYDLLNNFKEFNLCPTEQVVLSWMYFLNKHEKLIMYFPESESIGYNFCEIISQNYDQSNIQANTF
jgi:hypothetical protein